MVIRLPSFIKMTKKDTLVGMRKLNSILEIDHLKQAKGEALSGGMWR